MESQLVFFSSHILLHQTCDGIGSRIQISPDVAHQRLNIRTMCRQKSAYFVWHHGIDEEIRVGGGSGTQLQ